MIAKLCLAEIKENYCLLNHTLMYGLIYCLIKHGCVQQEEGGEGSRAGAVGLEAIPSAHF